MSVRSLHGGLEVRSFPGEPAPRPRHELEERAYQFKNLEQRANRFKDFHRRSVPRPWADELDQLSKRPKDHSSDRIENWAKDEFP